MVWVWHCNVNSLDNGWSNEIINNESNNGSQLELRNINTLNDLSDIY
jgi:hypothetical protein